MIISIDDSSEVPIYMQIRNQIVQGISDGRLSLGEQLPTVRGLADEIGINSMTVNKAYQLLKQDGYIVTGRRNGASVRTDIPREKTLSQASRDNLEHIISEAKISGMTLGDFMELCRKMY